MNEKGRREGEAVILPSLLKNKCPYRNSKTMCIKIFKLADVEYVQHQIMTLQVQL